MSKHRNLDEEEYKNVWTKKRHEQAEMLMTIYAYNIQYKKTHLCSTIIVPSSKTKISKNF